MDLLDCTVVGDVFLDVILKFNHDPAQFFRGGTTYINCAKAVLGGSGNVAVGLLSLGGKAAFVGKAGDDFFGKLYIRNLKKTQVVPKIFFEKKCSTGLVIALVNDGKQRSFLVFRGANDNLDTNEIDSEADLLRRSKYLYFSGYSLVNDPQRSAVLRAVELAKQFKTKIVFDPGAYNIVKSNRELFLKLLDLCDVFTPNLEEAQAITKATDLKHVISQLRGKVPLTALKCGENGSILIKGKNVLKIPSAQVTVSDPTGAGDAFTAALIYGLAHTLPLETTGKLANWVAAEVAAHLGSRGFPSKTKSNQFLGNSRKT